MSHEKSFLSLAGMPVGAILAFAGEKNKIPTGWLLCDGTEVKNTKYPKLFAAIGTAWGGSGTPNFYLPDLRGFFLRGVSEDSNNDPDKAQRLSPRSIQSPSNPGNQGNEVGSIQKDELKRHNHAISPNNAFMNNDGNTNNVDGGGDVIYSRSQLSTLDTGGNETRPINAYVHYLIKVDD
jgi:microcystin-dependent protein